MELPGCSWHDNFLESAYSGDYRHVDHRTRQLSLRDVGMARGDTVIARVKDKRFAGAVLVLLDLADKNYVVATVVLSNLAANKLGDGAI